MKNQRFPKSCWLHIRITFSVGLLLVLLSPLIAQQQPLSTPLPATAAIPPLPTFAGRDDLILKHLNAIITWYHNTSNQLPTVGLPTDAIYQANARLFAVQAVQVAFQSAGADALLVAHANPDAEATNTASQDITRLAPQLDAQVAQIKTQVELVNGKIASASGKALPALQEQRTRLQGELELLTAESTAVDQLAKFSSNVGAPTSSNLQRSIAQLERTVPEIGSSPGAKTPSTSGSSAPNATAVAQPGSGLIGEAEALFSQARSLHKIDVLAESAVETEDLAKQLRAPLVTEIHNTLNLAAEWSQAGNEAATAPGPTKQQFDALTVRFKQLAAASMPLSQEIIYLDESRANLTQWRQSLGQEYNAMLRSVLTRVGSIALSLAFLTLLSTIWRRFIFRYVHDVRRRRQFLILRRFVVGFLMGIVIILGFVSEFSSLATFAGFITAGLAVGLQTILLSVAAYFFLIGRYGIRVGDRISISGTTGDVIDVGLIRLYIMELAGTGTDIFPTGRIVVFPNSVLFQATVPLFKQIPGTDYAWHEVAGLLNAGADAKLVSSAILDAVRRVHETYRAEFERQHADSSRRIDLHLEVPAPSGLLQFATTGLEAVVRYPVGLGNAAKVDEQITQSVLAAMEHDPQLKAAIAGMPQIRVAVKG